MIEEIDALLNLLQSPPEKDDDRLEALTRILDGLAYAFHSLPHGISGDTADPPELTKYEDMRKSVSHVFPQFGFYPVIRPDAAANSEAMLADAVDDLADIALEIQQVKWRHDSSGPEDAAWAYHFGFRSHWGRHLHDLRSYCHCLQFDN